MKREYCVYIVAAGPESKPCKIGMSGNPERRLQDLQRTSPVALTMTWKAPCKSRVLAIQLERDLHAEFAPFRLHGEWFDLSDAEIVGLPL